MPKIQKIENQLCQKSKRLKIGDIILLFFQWRHNIIIEQKIGNRSDINNQYVIYSNRSHDKRKSLNQEIY